MAGYTPPSGTITLTIKRGDTQPAFPIPLILGANEQPTPQHVATILARTAGARARLIGERVQRNFIAARTAGARAALTMAHDINLLPALHAASGDSWTKAPSVTHSQAAPFQAATRSPIDSLAAWGIAHAMNASHSPLWQSALRKPGSGWAAWDKGDARSADTITAWQSAPSARTDAVAQWGHALRIESGEATTWLKGLPRPTRDLLAIWGQGQLRTESLQAPAGHGLLLLKSRIVVWQRAGYPSNAPCYGPPTPRPGGYIPAVGYAVLQLCSYSPPSAFPIPLILGLRACTRSGRVIVPIRRVYRMLNTCYLVRLPDRQPIPVTSMTIEADADSWCWSLSATAVSAAAWDLLSPQAPAFLPVEVEAGINGQVWRFMLDEPTRSREFVHDRTNIKGRSRSAWLQSPFTPKSRGVESNPRTAQQLAEQALANRGWTLIWKLPTDWLIPGGLYAWNATPIEQILALIRPVDGCLLTDPAQSILTAYPRYAMPAWLWDGQLADVSIPTAALRNLSQSPDYRPALNGCYVSGTQYGYTGFVKVSGTDGALQPTDPIVDTLLTHESAIRARGMAVLSAAGAGMTLTADMALASGDAGPGLLQPGMMAHIDGVKGVVRSVQVTAQWGTGLTVWQTIGIERRLHG